MSRLERWGNYKPLSEDLVQKQSMEDMDPRTPHGRRAILGEMRAAADAFKIPVVRLVIDESLPGKGAVVFSGKSRTNKK